MNKPRLFRSHEIAAQFGVSRARVYKWVAAGKLARPMKIKTMSCRGKPLDFWTADDVQKLIERRREAGHGPD